MRLLLRWDWWTSVHRTRMVVSIEVAASRFVAVRSFMERSYCPNGLGRNLVSLVRRGCRLGRRASEEVVDF